MTSRRRFLALLGAAAAAPTVLKADGPKRFSRWEMIFSSPDTVPAPLHPSPRSWSDDTITATWIGHATVLLNFYGVWIITDPAFSTRIGVNVAGLFTLGPKRLVAPPLRLEDLPPIDLILLSHAHMDHLDLPTLDYFDRSTPVIMAKNTSDVIDGLRFRKVLELDWGDKTRVAGVDVEALQVKHFGARYPWEDDRSRGNWNGRSYNGYLIGRRGKNLVFGGDTARQEFFEALRSRNLDLPLAMMPIGAYDPWIRNHASPEQSVAMAQQMNARQIFPMHWGTFIQSEEPAHEPIERLERAAPRGYVAVTTVGQTWVMEDGMPLSSPAG